MVRFTELLRIFMLQIVKCFQTCIWKVAPALATGNAFVYKPSPLSPLTAVLLGEVLAEAGLPPGVFGVVQASILITFEIGVLNQKLCLVT